MFREGGIHAAYDDAPPSVSGVFDAVMQVVVPSRYGVAPAVTTFSCEQEQGCGPKEKGPIEGRLQRRLVLVHVKITGGAPGKNSYPRAQPCFVGVVSDFRRFRFDGIEIDGDLVRVGKRRVYLQGFGVCDAKEGLGDRRNWCSWGDVLGFWVVGEPIICCGAGPDVFHYFLWYGRHDGF